MVRKLAVLIFTCAFLMISADDPNRFFLTAAKSVPRIGRSPNRNPNLDFEKFFLKASKSVPRIGRGNDMPFSDEQDVWQNSISYPTWTDIANLYEYHPELFANADLINQEYFSDHHLGSGRFKRGIRTPARPAPAA